MFLAHFKTRKIADLQSEEEIKAFVATLTMWKAMTGLKSEMSESESFINQTFIKSSFGQLTIAQLGLAAQMSFAGELGIDVNMYDKGFAPLYIGRVLSAFVKKNDLLLSKVMNEAKKLAANIPEEKRTLDQKRQDVRELVRNYLKTIKEKQKFEIDFKSTAYRVICAFNESELTESSKDYTEIAEQDLKEFMDANALNQVLLSHIRADRDNRLKSYMEFRHNLNFVLSLKDIDSWVDNLPDQILWPDQKEVKEDNHG